MSKLTRNDLFTKTEYADGTCIWRTKFAQIPVTAKAICEDGVLRTIRLNQTGGELRGRTSFGKNTMTGILWLKADPTKCPDPTGQTIPKIAVALHFKMDMKG